MPLRRKLLLFMTVPGLLIVALGGAGMFSILKLERAAEDILGDDYRTIQEARNLVRTLRAVEEASGGGDSPGREIERFELSARVRQAIVSCEENLTEEGERLIVHRLREAWDSVGPQLLEDGRGEPVAVRDPAGRAALIAPLVALADELIARNEDEMFSFERRERRIARFLFAAVAIASGVGLLTLLLFALGTANRVTRPLLAVAESLHRALEDSPGEPRSVSEGDEIERLRTELDDLLGRLEKHEQAQARRLGRLRDRFALVMEEVREGFILLDDDLRIVSLNRVGRALLELAPGEGEGRDIREIPVSEELAGVLESLTDRRPPDGCDLGEVSISLQAGRRTYRPRLLPIAPDTGTLTGFLLILWDVTEERRFAEARRKFIAMLSHELKTPVTSLTMSVSLLWEKFRGADEESDDLLSMAREDCALLSENLTQLIDASRGASRELAVRRKRTELAALLGKAVRPIAAQAEEKDIRFHDRLGPGGAFAEVDPIKFPWVVTNILGNALRYTPSGGSVALDLVLRDSEIEITVSDTGVGIAPHDLKRLFLPFTSLESDPETQSLGLGLTIAKEIIEAHQGEIEVSSELGKGTVFKIRVPAAEGEPA